MPANIKLKSRIIDDKDREILMILQDNGREKLTVIAKKVRLSIDSVHKRMKEMERKGVYEIATFIEPRVIGYPLVIDVKIKLSNITEEEKEKFIAYLSRHPRVIDLLSLMGDFDLTCVLIAKDSNDFDKVSTEIRQKYSKIIADWKGMLILKTYKFEEFDLTE